MTVKSSKIWFFIGLIGGFLSSRFMPENTTLLIELMIIAAVIIVSYGISFLFKSSKSSEDN